MKRYFTPFLFLTFFIIMLLFPRLIFQGASDGLLLWFQIVLPTLLPFMIISNLLVYTNSFRFINKFVSPILTRIFGISENSCIAVIVGFLCGYPMGAKITADLVREKYISVEEGQYLLSFCNNTSPFFILSYLIYQHLGSSYHQSAILIILFLSPVICSFITRNFYKPQIVSEHMRTTPISFDFYVLDTSINNALESITKIGGYIITFSIIIELLEASILQQNIWFGIGIAFLEITKGIPKLLTLSNSSMGVITVLMLTSFGGFCSIVQTKCMLGSRYLSVRKYTIHKIITALITGLLTYIYLIIIS